MRSYGQYCAVAKALDVVGDRWTLLIVRELTVQGPCRYTDIAHGLPGIASNLLSDRLRDLEDAGIVERRAAPPPVATTLYRLTTAGEELAPVLRALGRWGVRFMFDPGGDDEFRSAWLSFPITEYLRDLCPDDPPAIVEIDTGDRPVVVEVGGGEVTHRPGHADAPDLVLRGTAPLVLGALTGKLSAQEAAAAGLEVVGDADVLRRLRPEPSRQGAGYPA
ncbi:MAG TPA: winged helix-turn-helix transcriptional regulator [Candidatus Sulfotelmatobacter sp.]|nr:winged helix-turn-helix transcriptional regulator [Candidatus Sulfotelmatobacter sp.]